MSIIIDNFIQRLRTRRRGVLMLDYDGTIAPFHIDRMQAHPAPGVLDALVAIQETGTTRIVFVTGRESSEILHFVPLPKPYEIWGCHGREFRSVEGVVESHGMTAELEEAINEGHRRASRIVGKDLAFRKIGAVAVYWRPFTPQQRQEMQLRLTDAWRDLAEKHPLEIQVFHTGIEFALASRSKADSVNSVMETVDHSTTSAAFLGDEITDEEGFRALGSRGLSILVRNEERETAAHTRLSIPEGVVGFLGGWRKAVS
ncbi:trehalose-phosphatase [Candidatus Sumerlaeota bacterium]|nr:trehalose-phosphatase [Candidatus Sumerlaeota bacterium]